MKGGTIQIAWHGSEPVLSLDFHNSSGLLATAGADHDIKVQHSHLLNVTIADSNDEGRCPWQCFNGFERTYDETRNVHVTCSAFVEKANAYASQLVQSLTVCQILLRFFLDSFATSSSLLVHCLVWSLSPFVHLESLFVNWFAVVHFQLTSHCEHGGFLSSWGNP